MKFDTTINLGSMIELVGMIATLFTIYVRASDRLTKLETKMNILFDWFQSMTERDRDTIARFHGENRP